MAVEPPAANALTGSALRDPALLARTCERPWVVACGVSTAVHLGLLTALALIWWSLPESLTGASRHSLLVDTTVDPIEDLDLAEIPEVTIPVTESTATVSGGESIAVRTSPAEVFAHLVNSESNALAGAASRQGWMDADVAAEATLAVRRVGAGDGSGTGAGSDTGPGFFGLPPAGHRFVYVLDCSRSMNHPHNTEAKTRFKRMKIELVRSVGTLTPEREFFLVFFNDEPIVMPARIPVPAVPATQQKYLQWMSELKARGQTEPLVALQIALSMNPDVIYFLTDGSFSYGVEQSILGLRSGRTRIHTFGFAETMTPEMHRAYELLSEKKGARARQAVETKKEFDHVVAVWKAHQFLETMATRHDGTFRIIPDDE